LKRDEETQFRCLLQEKVLKSPDNRVVHFRTDRVAERHRLMRIASLMCGTPEQLDVSNRCPTLLRGFCASPDTCTQPRAWWIHYEDSADILSHLESTLLSFGRPAVDGFVCLYLIDRPGPPAVFDIEYLASAAGMRAPQNAAEAVRLRAAISDIQHVFNVAFEHNQPVLFRKMWKI
jgi:hypothetical protein